MPVVRRCHDHRIYVFAIERCADSPWRYQRSSSISSWRFPAGCRRGPETATHSAPGTFRAFLSKSDPCVPVPIIPNRTASEGAGACSGPKHLRFQQRKRATRDSCDDRSSGFGQNHVELSLSYELRPPGEESSESLMEECPVVGKKIGLGEINPARTPHGRIFDALPASNFLEAVRKASTTQLESHVKWNVRWEKSVGV